MESKRVSFSRSNLLLVEILLAVMFFSLASAVCLQLFAHSHQMSREAVLLEASVSQGTSVAELLRYNGCRNNEEAIRCLQKAGYHPALEEEKIRLSFGENGNESEVSAAELALILSLQKDDGLVTWQIALSDVKKDGKILTTIPLTIRDTGASDRKEGPQHE